MMKGAFTTSVADLPKAPIAPILIGRSLDSTDGDSSRLDSDILPDPGNVVFPQIMYQKRGLSLVSRFIGAR